MENEPQREVKEQWLEESWPTLGQTGEKMTVDMV